MPEQKKNSLELFDVSSNSVIGELPLDTMKHLPRLGERIFLPLPQQGEWAAYRIVDIEYFLSTLQNPFDAPGMIRITVYVRKSD